MSDDFTTYFANTDHDEDAPTALKHVLERYLGFIAEVARDHAYSSDRDTVTEQDVREAAEL